MNRRRKEELQRLFEAPKPVNKRAFLRKLQLQPMRIQHVLWIQFSYISKWEWVLSAALFAVITFLSFCGSEKVFVTILSMMPVIAVTSVSESTRSQACGMDELEMTTRFSLKSIVLARMGILGTENLLVTLFAALMLEGKVFQIMMYLIVPYLITVYGCLKIVLRISGKEGVYSCMGFSMFVVLILGLSYIQYHWIYHTQFLFVWVAVMLLFIHMNYKEGKRLVVKLQGLAY